MYTFVITGVPVPWSAHQGYGKKAYNPRGNERARIQWQLRALYNQQEPLNGAIKVALSYYLPIPKGTSGIRQRQMLLGTMYHLKRPDIDNLNKFVCDCLKTIVFQDDSQIVDLEAKKYFGENPKTVIVVSKLS